MRLGTLKDGTPDGSLVVVSKDGTRCAPVPDIARTLQGAIERWSLRALARPELKTGFGWIQAKPPCGMAPFAITPDDRTPFGFLEQRVVQP